MFSGKGKHGVDDGLVKLRTAGNTYELGVIQSMLEDAEIPYLLNDRESGGYMRLYSGSSIYGTDIMVGEDYIDRARELMEGINWDESPAEEIDEEELTREALEAEDPEV